MTVKEPYPDSASKPELSREEKISSGRLQLVCRQWMDYVPLNTYCHLPEGISKGKFPFKKQKLF